MAGLLLSEKLLFSEHWGLAVGRSWTHTVCLPHQSLNFSNHEAGLLSAVPVQRLQSHISRAKLWRLWPANWLFLVRLSTKQCVLIPLSLWLSSQSHETLVSGILKRLGGTKPGWRHDWMGDLGGWMGDSGGRMGDSGNWMGELRLNGWLVVEWETWVAEWETRVIEWVTWGWMGDLWLNGRLR